MKINCEKIIFFENPKERKIMAIYIKCAVFEKLFVFDKEIRHLQGNHMGLKIEFRGDNNRYIFTADKIDCITLKSYETQIEEYLDSL